MELHELNFGALRDNWGQGCIDQLLEMNEGALLPEWTFQESRPGRLDLTWQLVAWSPEGRLFVYVDPAHGWYGPFFCPMLETYRSAARVDRQQIADQQRQIDRLRGDLTAALQRVKSC